MIAMRPLSLMAITLLACVALPGTAHAEGLQVAPVSVEISERSGVLWLSNGSDQPLRAQVRVFRWHQDNGEDELVETQDLVASPPFAEVRPGAQQVIRLVRFGEAANAASPCEESYRIIVDELPSAEARDQPGLDYVLRYSVPVYLTSAACNGERPSLSWQIEAQDGQAFLKVSNSGQVRAQLANVRFVKDSGESTTVTGGLLGYVLPGATRRFALAHPAAHFADGGQIEVQLNGAQTMQPVSLALPGQ